MIGALLRSIASRTKNLWLRFVVCSGNEVQWARHLGVRIGNDCRVLDSAQRVFGSEPYLVRLGDHVSITHGVRFHTHEGGVWIFRHMRPDLDVFAPIAVGDNVFFGTYAVVMPGVTIGDNVVIGAGAVVTRDIPSDCIAVGVPARVIGDLDSYWEKIEPIACDIRTWPEDRKREFLINTFLSR